MKKILFTILVASIIGTAMAAKTLRFNGGTSEKNVMLMDLKALYVLNPGGEYGVSEDIDITILNDVSYDRAYTKVQGRDLIAPTNATISTYLGKGNVGEYTKVPYRCCYQVREYLPTETNFVLILEKDGWDDPAAYYGELKFMYTNVEYMISYRTYTDPKKWKMIAEYHNNYFKNYLDEPGADFVHEYTIGTAPLSMDMGLDAINLDGTIIDDWFYRADEVQGTTQLVVRAYQRFDKQHSYDLLNYNCGNSTFSITNLNSILIPDGSRIRVTTQDKNTTVGIIYE